MNKILKNTFLFRGIDEETTMKIAHEFPPEEKHFQRGETVYSSDSEESYVGFILDGRCEVRKIKPDSSVAVLNILQSNDSFGILSVLSEDKFPTQIIATKNSTILCFTKEQILNIVNNYSQIAMNLISFLANRISFLNEKIATVSATRVEERLALHLLSESRKSGSLSFTFNCKKCAETINAGRASVYRALTSLQETGLISIVDKKIIINDLNGLERISQ